MTTIQNSEWSKFHLKSFKLNKFPKYPNEIILKTLFGDYTKHNIKLGAKSRVLDIGCGFGNNLIPFIDKDCGSFGIEIDNRICNLTKKILKNKYPNKKITIKVGHNRLIPFKKNFFDLVLTNTLHYEESLKDFEKSINEIKRVLKKNKYFFLTITANKHDFFQKTKKISKNIYLNTNKQDEIRYGKKFFFIENEKGLKKLLLSHFKKVVTGRVTEIINKNCFDIYLALCIK